jgi:hypothetical protein
MFPFLKFFFSACDIARVNHGLVHQCPAMVEGRKCTEAEFLDEIQKKVLRVFLLTIQSHLYSFALRFLFLQTHATSYSFKSALLYTVKEKGG